MKIKEIKIVNFKRFTDLTITNIPDNAKLVLMTGVNGSGKSCIFDAFEVSSVMKERDGFAFSDNKDYYSKNRDTASKISIKFTDNQTISLTNESGGKVEVIEKANIFYGRSSLRQVPQLTKIASNKQINFEKDSDRPRLYIERDERFENDIDKISRTFLREVYTLKGVTVDELANKYISKINRGFKRIFGENEATSLSLLSIIPSLEGNPPEIKFKKGNSEIHYNLLSSGEKEIFNLLLNLYSRSELYQDSIYFIDELDLHLNTNLQYTLLNEIVENWIPENCQLWTASHSFGFIDYARSSDKAVILDFNEKDFDIPQTLVPSIKSSLDVFEVAIPKETIFKLFDNKKLILCENLNDKFYNYLNIENVVFIGVKDCRTLFLTMKKDNKYYGLRDRDFITDTEKQKIERKYPLYKILTYYCFENYIYHPDNIEQLNLINFEKQVYCDEMIHQKNEKIDYILTDIKLSRNNYEELKEDKMKDNDISSIVNSLKSNSIEEFLKFFSIKDKFNKEYLQKWNIQTEQLVRTNWFKERITEIIKTLP